MQFNFVINPRKVAFILGTIALCLATISIIGEYFLEVVFVESDNAYLLLIDLFSVNVEKSIPTWYSTLLLFCAALSIALIASSKWAEKDAFRWYWIGLAFVFLYLSMDEGAAIHEYLTDPLFYAFNTRGYLYFAWVLVAVPLVIVFGLIYLRFLVHLPPMTAFGFVFAAVIYTGGAIFLEGLSANYLYDYGNNIDFNYLAIATLEELFEMFGVIIFITTLQTYMQQAQAHFTLTFSGDASPTEEKTKDESSQKAIPERLEQVYQQVMQTGTAPYVIVFFAGINLILIQWVLVRELTTMLRGTELVILLVTVSYFVGLSIGYRVAGRIQKSWLKLIGTAVLFLHLTLPLWFRLLVIGLDKIGAFGLAFVLLPILVPFVVSAFYSIFLPLFIDDGEAKLGSLYAVEILGSVFGVLCLVFLASWGITTIFTIYMIILLAILAFLGMSRLWWMRITLLAIGCLWFFPMLNLWTNTLWFQQIQDLPNNSRTLFTAYSPYQKVDVLEDPQGNRYLFLDSMEHYSNQFGVWLNIVMGRIPASLIEPENAVAFGAGSMELEQMISNYAGHVTTVEIDPMVIDASLQFFAEVNQMDKLANRTIVVDDAKHFIANTDEHYDLIVSALPAAFTIQNGALYSVEFLEQVKAKLTPDGVFVANLTSIFTPDDLISRRISASVLATFDEVMVVTSDSAGLSFIFAADELPFNTEEVRLALEANGETNYAIFETNTVRVIVGDAQAMTLDSLDVILEISRDRIISQFWGR